MSTVLFLLNICVLCKMAGEQCRQVLEAEMRLVLITFMILQMTQEATQNLVKRNDSAHKR